MKGDFTRDTFDAKKRYLRVLLQQGRVSVDADWNEQVAILLHRLETLARDLIGPYGGPEGECGFAILPDDKNGPLRNDFRIGTGRYYVDGLLCENDHEDLTFSRQLPEHTREQLRSGPAYLIYLDAWEEYVSADEDPSRREIALGGPDTAGRSKVMWRVRAWELDERWVRAFAPREGSKGFTNDKIDEAWPDIVRNWQHNRGRLKVRVADPAAAEDLLPAIVSPNSRYRGAENHLYRVEVHHSGHAAAGDSVGSAGEVGANIATFKWSRENGSVLFPVISISGPILTLRNLGSDLRSMLAIGDWVELIEPHNAVIGRPGHLFRINDIKPLTREITLEVRERDRLPARPEHLLIRRWDQKARPEHRRGRPLHDGAVVIVEGDQESNWLTLEDGIHIQFQRGENHYRNGDYWLIPARIADGGIVEWPDDERGRPLAAAPHGVTHRYAPIGIVTFGAAGTVDIECYSRIAFRMSLDRPSLTRA